MHDKLENENSWYCYVMQCADNSLYTGITNDLDKRLTAHNNGTASKYTRCRLPVQLVYYEPHASRSAASQREAQIKQLSRVQKLAFIKPLDAR
ncbi:MAG TPA: GIY-YIG nuclease family protein [Gammaproteobacteria bacterium]|nr:GIY-YIG nuclease family protein [Gammaproteobacteria bacterium]